MRRFKAMVIVAGNAPDDMDDETIGENLCDLLLGSVIQGDIEVTEADSHG